MSEYILRPETKLLPPPPELLEDLARRGWRVEMNLKGSPEAWEGVRFFRPGPPEEVECFLLREPETGTYNVSLPAMPAHRARELQFHVLDCLKTRLGGHVEDVDSGRTLTDREYGAWSDQFRPPIAKLFHGSFGDLFWRFFPWAVAAGGAAYAIYGPADRRLVSLGVAALGLLSALGLAFSERRT